MYGFEELADIIRQGKPINIYGYMCSGKTTFCEKLQEYGYKEVDEHVWKIVIEDVGLTGKITNSAIGSYITDCYTELIAFAVKNNPEVLDKKILNVWMPHALGDIAQINLRIKRPECIINDRNWAGTPWEHFATVDKRFTVGFEFWEEQQVTDFWRYMTDGVVIADDHVKACMKKFILNWAFSEDK